MTQTIKHISLKGKILAFSKSKSAVIWLLFLLILSIDLYLRYWQYANNFSFGWDQARDGWKVRDILHGQMVMNGPRTGVGHVHLAPLWFYFLAPFYYFLSLDPVASMYANVVVAIFNSITFFYVTKKIFGSSYGLLASYIMAINGYLISIMKVPWNVSPVLGVSALIFYCIYEIVFKERYKLIFLLMALAGFFVNLHFAVVFLPPIIVFSLVLVKNKLKTIKYLFMSLPLFLIWFLPLLFLDIEWKGGNSDLLRRFMNDYFIGGFHVRFFIHRLNDALIQIEKMFLIHYTITWGKLVPILIFAALTFFEDKKGKMLNYLILLWFAVPSVMYSFYGGTTSEYYMLLSAPMAIYIMLYLCKFFLHVAKHFRIKRVAIFLLAILWIYYGSKTSAGHWVKRSYGGLNEQKDNVLKKIREGGKIEYNEGDPSAYIFAAFTEKGIK